MTNEKKYALNTSTGRYCVVGSKTYIRARKGGHIREPEPVLAVDTAKQPEPVLAVDAARQSEPQSRPDNVVVEGDVNDELKSKLAQECSDIVNQHVSQFKGITQKQTDTLLRRMLYEKLCID
jgi:hypothetical protein